MIILDTNVISEIIKPEAHPMVETWADEQISETLYLSSVTIAELLFGIGILPPGKRKNLLAQTVDNVMETFHGRILPFDLEAAHHHAALAIIARKSGRGFPTPDGYIAAIAASRKFIVASRYTAPYESAGVQVINPWQSVTHSKVHH